MRKLKYLKEQAEQYVIEATQITLRLSTENFKLKEDLICERQLTRKIELKVQEGATLLDRAEADAEAKITERALKFRFPHG